MAARCATTAVAYPELCSVHTYALSAAYMFPAAASGCIRSPVKASNRITLALNTF